MRVAAVVVLGLLALAGDAAGQASVLVRTAYLPPDGCTSAGCPSAVFSYDPDSRALLGTTPVSAGEGAYLTPDGALLVAFDPFTPALIALDRASGREFSVALPSAAGLVGSPIRPEVYVNDATGGLALGFGGARRMHTPACGSPPGAVAVSADGRRVVYRCYPGGGNPGYTAVLDTASGALVRAFTNGWSPVLNGDGSVLFQAESGPTGMLLRRYLVDAGTLDAETEIAASFLTPTMAFDPRSRRVFVWAEIVAAVFDEVTLAMQPVGACATAVTAVAFERDRPRAFLVGYRPYEPYSFDDGVFCELDTTSLAVTASHFYTKPRSGAQAVAVAEPPRPPAMLTSQVTGASVALTWQPAGPPAAVTRYVLEVGSAPGLSDIVSGLDVGLQTSFGANGVPPGTYYVRVRAGNYAGLSAPSNEVVVQVP